MQDTKYVWSETKSLIISPSFVSKHIGIALTDNTDIPFEVAEMIIAHKTGSKVARTYLLRTRDPEYRLILRVAVAITMLSPKIYFIVWLKK